MPIGLVTGSKPFAGLPTNPAELVLPALDGQVIEGIRIVARATPVSFGRLPTLLPDLVRETRPAFVLALGIALGAPTIRIETMAINAAHFGVADSEGVRPLGGAPFAPAGPAGRAATWDAAAVVEAIMAKNIPARLSFHAGTHLCNMTLYTYLGALAAEENPAPCGFLHLPYLPEQVVWMMRERPGETLDLPSMPLETQIVAVTAALHAMALQANAVHRA